jgi:hypothetical protein
MAIELTTAAMQKYQNDRTAKPGRRAPAAPEPGVSASIGMVLFGAFAIGVTMLWVVALGWLGGRFLGLW